MQTIYDIQQYLKKFNIYIYTGNRIGDLELMAMEIAELYHLGIIEIEDFRMAQFLIQREIRILKEGKETKWKN